VPADIKKEPIFCALAFNAVSWTATGEPNPCCGTRGWIYPHDTLYMTYKERINHPYMKAVRKELMKGNYPKVCGLCADQEKNNQSSMRTIWNSLYETYYGDNKHISEEVDPNKIFAIDINIGNKCNSKCMTCGVKGSDLWIDEAEYIFGKDSLPINELKRLENYFMLGTVNSVDTLIKSFPNIKKITFVGGEPTISPHATGFLNRLIKTGLSKNINLSYTTNLTGITDEMLELWSNFQGIGLNLSIDGYGKTNDYIRYPFKWNKIESNLNQCLEKVDGKTFSVGLSLTASMFNCISTHELLEYWYDKTRDIKYVCGVMVNKATSPSYIDMRLLSNEYRNEGVAPLLALKNIISDDLKFASLVSSIDTLTNFLLEPMISDHSLKGKSLDFITKSDQFRKRDIQNYLPELYAELIK